MRKDGEIVLIIPWKGKIYTKGLRITEEDFWRVFPKDDPEAQEKIWQEENEIKTRFERLARAGYRTLLCLEKIGSWNTEKKGGERNG